MAPTKLLEYLNSDTSIVIDVMIGITENINRIKSNPLFQYAFFILLYNHIIIMYIQLLILRNPPNKI